MYLEELKKIFSFASLKKIFSFIWMYCPKLFASWRTKEDLLVCLGVLMKYDCAEICNALHQLSRLELKKVQTVSCYTIRLNLEKHCIIGLYVGRWKLKTHGKLIILCLFFISMAGLYLRLPASYWDERIVEHLIVILCPKH